MESKCSAQVGYNLPENTKLHHILAAMRITSSHAPEYHICEHQCYWYAGMVASFVATSQRVLDSRAADSPFGKFELLEVVSVATIRHDVLTLQESFEECVVQYATDIAQTIDHEGTKRELEVANKRVEAVTEEAERKAGAMVRHTR